MAPAGGVNVGAHPARRQGGDAGPGLGRPWRTAGPVGSGAAPAIGTDIVCPKDNAFMNLREGKRGPWLGWSTFPKCKSMLAIDSLCRLVTPGSLPSDRPSNRLPSLRISGAAFKTVVQGRILLPCRMATAESINRETARDGDHGNPGSASSR